MHCHGVIPYGGLRLVTAKRNKQSASLILHQLNRVFGSAGYSKKDSKDMKKLNVNVYLCNSVHTNLGVVDGIVGKEKGSRTSTFA